MYGQSAVIYLSAAVCSACTIAGDSDVAVKQQEVACNLCSPNELRSYRTGSFTARRNSRFGGTLLKHGPCTRGSVPERSGIIKQTCIYVYISLVIQYLGIKEKESKSCHRNVTHWRAGALQYVLFNWIHWEISLKRLFSVYISRQAIKKKKRHNRSHHIMSFTKEAVNLIINVSWRRRLL